MRETNKMELSHSLHQAIEKWFTGRSSAETLPDAYWADHITEQMTDAAMAVFLAAVDSSQFTEEESK